MLQFQKISQTSEVNSLQKIAQKITKVSQASEVNCASYSWFCSASLLLFLWLMDVTILASSRHGRRWTDCLQESPFLAVKEEKQELVSSYEQDCVAVRYLLVTGPGLVLGDVGVAVSKSGVPGASSTTSLFFFFLVLLGLGGAGGGASES